MISKINGTLEAIGADHAQVVLAGGVTLEVMLPAFTAVRLQPSEGETVTLHTILYFEAQAQGTTIMPRLAGFATEQDRAFYQLFVTCKGIGYRRALRAMTLSSDRIATAIADRDIATLKSLPEIGKRTAETICPRFMTRWMRSPRPVRGVRRRAGACMAGLALLREPRPRRGDDARGAGGASCNWAKTAATPSAGSIGRWRGRCTKDEEALIAEVYRLKAGG